MRLEGGRAKVDEFVGGKRKRMGMRQDLKLGTAHGEVDPCRAVRPNRKMRLSPHSLIGAV